jgi:hypothetical protein
MRRGTLVVAALCVAILGIGVGLYTVVFRDRPGVERPILPAPPAGTAATALPPLAPVSFFDVMEVSGAVEVRRSGAWTPLRRGDRVLPSETIRTGVDASAVVRAPSGDELILRQRVELAADVLSETVTELTLTRGRVRAAAGAGTERLRITSHGAETVAPAGSRFTVFADQRGAVAVASEAGDIKVIGQGESVVVGAGRQTYVPPGGPPRPSEPIPDEVFLAVAWPKGEVHARRVKLAGKVRPGTEVEINDEVVVVDDEGAFQVDLPLPDGRNKLRVEATSVDGRTNETRRNVMVDTRGPPLQVDPLQYDTPKKPP